MKMKLITLVMMIAACCSAMAQNWLWEVPAIPADTTIVREWQAGKYIVYSRTGTVYWHALLSTTCLQAQELSTR